MLNLKRLGLLIVTLAALVLAVGVLPAYAAGMTVDPTYGNYSTSFSVQADGFAKNEKVALWVGLADSSTVSLGNTTADSSGSISFSVSPGASWRPGEVIVVARGLNSKRQASTKFTLAKQESESTSTTTSSGQNLVAFSVNGLTLTYEGSGYQAGERVAAWFQYPSELATKTAHALPDVVADSSGNVSFAFTVGKDWPFGGYQITAQGAKSKNVTFNTFSYFGTITNQFEGVASSGTTTNGTWQAYYFDNPDLSGSPVLVRTDAAINFNWGTSSPGSNVPADNFSVRWLSTRSVPTGDNYTITATTDDGMRVWVDGTLVIDEWFDQPATTYSTTVYLGQGNHTFQVEYYEHTLDAVAIVSINAN